MAPVRRHLAAAGGGIVFRADCFEHHFVGSDTEREHESAVAVVREKPVVGRLQDKAGGDQSAFVSCAADLEVDFVLALELDFAVVEAAREKHQAVDADKGVAIEALVLRGVEFGVLGFGLCGHGVRLSCKPRGRSEDRGHYSELQWLVASGSWLAEAATGGPGPAFRERTPGRNSANLVKA